MKVVSLVDNLSGKEGIGCEHGLSLYIETTGHKILFDTGASGLFLENAEKLNININDVDFAVVSHGHYDHGGGLKRFLEANPKAKVFVREEAFGKFYARRADGRKNYIGLDEELKTDKRMVFTKESFIITEDIGLFSGVKERELYPSFNKDLLTENAEGIHEDTFRHEQNLVVTENGKRVLFAGCAHNGIVNIIRRFEKLTKYPLDYVFAGLHLYNPLTKETESEEYVARLGEFLKKTKIKFYTCHCTGTEAYNILKSIMQNQIQYFAAGDVIDI